MFQLSLLLQEQKVSCATDIERSIVWTCLTVHWGSMTARELISYTKARWLLKGKKKAEYDILFTRKQKCKQNSQWATKEDFYLDVNLVLQNVINLKLINDYIK